MLRPRLCHFQINVYRGQIVYTVGQTLDRNDDINTSDLALLLYLVFHNGIQTHIQIGVQCFQICRCRVAHWATRLRICIMNWEAAVGTIGSYCTVEISGRTVLRTVRGASHSEHKDDRKSFAM